MTSATPDSPETTPADSPESAPADAPETTPADAPEATSADAPETAAVPATDAETATPEEAAPDSSTPVDADAASEAAPSAEAPSAAAPESTSAEPWGRVDDDGTVSVREGDDWRVVGQYPDGTPDEALAYFERKFSDLASEVTLLEVRHRRGGASASDLRSAARTVRGRLSGAAAVGNLAALEKRIAALEGALSEATAEEAHAQRAAVEAAIAERETIVAEIEAIAAKDPRSIQWKQTTADVAALFARWQEHQTNGPRLPKATGQQLWKRFRDARAIVDRNRREFYAGLDEQHKSARDAKTRLVERAEALAPQGEDGIGAYRTLLDQWKSAGRAGKKVDDALWARFKAAGDVLYSARIDREAADTEASKEKIDAKKALLDEAAAVPAEKNNGKARSLLTNIQRRWDDIGRVFPRETERALDDQLRKIENTLKQREDDAWKRDNPETKARQNDMTSQLQDAISKLEDELAAAEKTKDPSAIAAAKEALDARKAWLRALGG